MTHPLSPERPDNSIFILPPPVLTSPISVEQAIARRRSTREFSELPLSLEQISQLLWSAQGVTNEKHSRSSPSAGATYPLELFLVAGVFCTGDLQFGLYSYVPVKHGLRPILSKDLRLQLTGVAMGQQAINLAPVSIVIAADYERTRNRYKNRTERYVHMEAGHAAQNIYLQATALGLGTTAIGAFDDNGVKELLSLTGNLQPLYIMPVGHAA